MNQIVLYKSKTGFARKYALWIAEALNCEAVSLEKAASLHLEDFDTIIYGGGVYAGRINGLSEFKKQFPRIKTKTIIIFATGSSPEDSPQVEECINQNLTPEERTFIKAYYFQGGLNYEAMSLKDKAIMSFLKKVLKGKKDKTPEETGMLAAISASFSNQTKLQIEPLIDCCKSTT